jgi:membrane protein
MRAIAALVSSALAIAGVRGSSTTPVGRDWRGVLRRSLRATMSQQGSLAAAGIAFYIVWALFPALAIAIVVLARIVGRHEVLAILTWVRPDLPDSFNTIVVGQLDAIARNLGAVSVAAIVMAAVVALWGALRGANGLMAALNAVYGARETRGVWHRVGTGLALALLGGAFLVSALACMVSGITTTVAPSNAAIATLIAPSRWPPLFLTMLIVLAAAYRFGPSREGARWRWITWGAAVAAGSWLSGSFTFAWLATNAVHANPLLGSLGSVMLFLLWTYLTVLAILFGAHIDAELEGRGRREPSQ